METKEETLQKIRNELRRQMNGVASSSMRKKGLDYKINFGVEIPRLKSIAQQYNKDLELAELLWSLQTRELKILATLLCPINDFSYEKAMAWINEVPNQEIREQLSMNLLQETDFADRLVESCLKNEEESMRITGYWLIARLFISSSQSINKLDISWTIESAFSDLLSESEFLSRSALNVLKHTGRRSLEDAAKILNKLVSFKESDNPIKQEIYNSLHFEFEFYK